MPKYRSHTTMKGKNMAGARALWRATGLKDEDFDKPLIAISNSYTQFVPCLLYTSPSPRDATLSRMPSSA